MDTCFRAFSTLLEFGIMFEWPNQRSKSGGWGTRSRSVLWRHAHLPGDRGTARAVPKLHWREARAAGVPGGQPVLYQALCPLRGPALPGRDDQGHRPGQRRRMSWSDSTRSAIFRKDRAAPAQIGDQPAAFKNVGKRYLAPIRNNERV